MTYELPMKDGNVDWDAFSCDWGVIECDGIQYDPKTIFKDIDAHARAEERERCENVCWEEHKQAGDGTDGAYRLQRAILAIRNMGDEI